MMIELGKTKRQSIRPICEGSSEVLVRGAMDGNLGRIWVPDLTVSPYCLIVVGGFGYLLGLPPKGAGALDLKSQIYESAAAGCLYPQNERWREWLEGEFNGHLRTVTRYALRQGKEGFDPERLRQHIKSVPQGFRIKRVDEKLYNMVMKEEWSRDLGMGFETYKEFEPHGFGYGAVKGQKLAAGCLAYGVGEGVMEVQVKTKKEHRRQGLALACSSAFVLECLEKAVIPNWNATNQQSVELALKLGYVYEREYQAYEILEPEESL